MMQQNWFDTAFADTLKQATADQALAEVAKNPRIRKAVQEALAAHDANSKKPGWAGPSRTQAVRTALADVLQAP